MRRRRLLCLLLELVQGRLQRRTPRPQLCRSREVPLDRLLLLGHLGKRLRTTRSGSRVLLLQSSALRFGRAQLLQRRHQLFAQRRERALTLLPRLRRARLALVARRLRLCHGLTQRHHRSGRLRHRVALLLRLRRQRLRRQQRRLRATLRVRQPRPQRQELALRLGPTAAHRLLQLHGVAPLQPRQLRVGEHVGIVRLRRCRRAVLPVRPRRAPCSLRHLLQEVALSRVLLQLALCVPHLLVARLLVQAVARALAAL